MRPLAEPWNGTVARVDATMAGLVGSFGGAVVGGLMGAAASWLTTSQQWAREADVRSQDRVEEGVQSLLTSLAFLTDAQGWMVDRLRLSPDFIVAATVLEARALAHSPHLARTMRSIDEDSADGTMATQSASQLAQVLLDWSFNRHEYERAQRTAIESVEYMKGFTAVRAAAN